MRYPSLPLARALLLLLLCGLLLSACTDPRAFSFSTVEQHYLTANTPDAYWGEGTSITARQSFMPTHDGLHRIAFTIAFPEAQPVADGSVSLRLLDDNGQPVYIADLPPETFNSREPYLLLFEPQPDSALRVYTLELTLAPELQLLADGENRYAGRLSTNGDYHDGDLLLEWGYKPTPAVLAHDALTFMQRWGVPSLLNVLLWTLPGLALLAWLRRGASDPWGIPMLLGAAWSLGGALLVLIPMVAWWVGLPLGTWAVWVLLLLSAVALALAWRRSAPFGAIDPLSPTTWLYLALLGVIIISRVAVIHPLNAPLWGDSVHHSLITQLLLDNSGIFDSYEPYLPLAPFTYHAGFHLLCAWLGWSVLPGSAPLSGMEATLIGGQWQNVVAVVMVALLAEGLLRRAGQTRLAPLAGIVALLVAGLLNEMPAFYVNWGRYTQLAGQIFLPTALLWSLFAWHPQMRRRWSVAAVLTVAALALTHYRVLILYAVALPLLVAALLWRTRPQMLAVTRSVVARSLAAGVATLALILPWYWKLQESVILQRTQQMLATTASQSTYLTEYNAFGDLTQYVPQWLLVAAGVALALLLLQRSAVGWLIGGWTLAMLLVANPEWLNLPGTGLVNNFMLQIALYLPLAVLVGCAAALAAGSLARRLPVSARRAFAAVSALVLLALAGWGAWQQVQLAEARWYSFLTVADWRAARWIEENTPADSDFHVNGFFAYAGTTVAGSDGGEWLPLTAGRATTVPPMIYAHEAGIDPDYRAEVNARYARLEAAESDPQQLANVMRTEGVEYIYVGAQQGMVGKPPDDAPLEPLALASSPAFETVYTDDFVWIFRPR